MKNSRLLGAVCAYLFKIAGVIVFSSLVSLPAHAVTTYTYTGNDFTNISDSPSFAGTYDALMSVSGYITINTPLTSSSGIDVGVVFPGLRDVTSLISSFSFSDGRQVLDQTNTNNNIFIVKMDNSGNIVEWRFVAEFLEPTPYNQASAGMVIQRAIQTWNTPSSPYFSSSVDSAIINYCNFPLDQFGNCAEPILYDQGNDQASVGSNQGYWVSDAVVPIPASVWLFGSGLLGLISMARRKKTA